MKDEFYIPDKSRICSQSTKNKQCSGEELSFDIQTEAVEEIRIACDKTYQTYKHLLDLGTAREIARIVLPNNLYTEFYWKVDLRNLFNFISLRSDDHAQWEIQQYSNTIKEIIREIVPVALNAFENER